MDRRQLTEWILGGNWLSQLDRVTDSVLVGGRDAEQVLVLVMEIAHLGGQLGWLADLLPRLPLDVLLLDDVVSDGAAAVVLRHFPL